MLNKLKGLTQQVGGDGYYSVNVHFSSQSVPYIYQSTSPQVPVPAVPDKEFLIKALQGEKFDIDGILIIFLAHLIQYFTFKKRETNTNNE